MSEVVASTPPLPVPSASVRRRPAVRCSSCSRRGSRRRRDLRDRRRGDRAPRPVGAEPARDVDRAVLAHLFGTDDLGRDMFSRTIAGARTAVVGR